MTKTEKNGMCWFMLREFMNTVCANMMLPVPSVFQTQLNPCSYFSQIHKKILKMFASLEGHLKISKFFIL